MIRMVNLACAAILLLCLSCNHSRVEEPPQSELLVGEDFGTGLLAHDLSVPQSDTIARWAAERGFVSTPDDEGGLTDETPSEYVREDGLKLSYSYSLTYRGPTHNLTLEYSYPLDKPLVPVKGVPLELTPGSPLDAVIRAWGLGSESNRKELWDYRRGRLVGIAAFTYQAERDGVWSALSVAATDGTVFSVSLLLGPVDDQRS